MAVRALGWLQNKIGLDITGQNEFERNRQLDLSKKFDQSEESESKLESRLAELRRETAKLSIDRSSATTTTTSGNGAAAAASSSRSSMPADGKGMSLLDEKVSAEVSGGAHGTTATTTTTTTTTNTKTGASSSSSTWASPPDHRSVASSRASTSTRKPKEALTVTPSKIYFPLPLDKYIMNTLLAHNTTDGFVSYKVKATAPTRYAVKPRHGVLGPKERTEIHVTLRPTTQDPNELHDKFLIQFFSLSNEEIGFYNRTGDVRALWQTKRDVPTGIKIRCKFRPNLPPNFVVKSVAEVAAEEKEDGMFSDDGAAAIDDDDDDEGPGGAAAAPVTGTVLPAVTHKRHCRTLADNS